MNRPDFSNYVAHFSKDADPVGENPGMGSLGTAINRLANIVRQKTIKTSIMPWTNKPAVCFTECPFYSLLDHKQRYSAYGIGFTKNDVFTAGGGPAIYLRQNLHQIQLDAFEHKTLANVKGFHKDIYAFVTPFRPAYDPNAGSQQCDYSYEREWRVTSDFVFSEESIVFITVQKISDIDRIRSAAGYAISDEKFIIFDVVERIESLWPTHRI